MTDEATGGKPLFCESVHPTQAAMDRMQDAGWMLLCERGELATDLAVAHVTIPTAALTELLAAAEECAEDLDGQISDRWPYADRSPEPPIIRQTVRRLRAAVARVRGE